jgi:hypothetical protein
MKIIIALLLIFPFFIFAEESVFEKIEWEKVYESGGVSLSVQKNKNEKVNYYKAEKTINLKKADPIIKSILDFDNYSKIFPRTTEFKKIKDLSENKFIIYSYVNFKPLKDRDYYITFEYNIIKNPKNGREFIAEWYPMDQEDFNYEKPKKNCIRVKNIFGKWTINELGDKIKISVELHNNFELNIPVSASYPYEVTSAVETLEDIISYSLKK